MQNTLTFRQKLVFAAAWRLHSSMLKSTQMCHLYSNPLIPLSALHVNHSRAVLQVRTKNFEPSLDLGAYGGLALRVKGDGLRYKCTIRTDTNWDGIGYTL